MLNRSGNADFAGEPDRVTLSGDALRMVAACEPPHGGERNENSGADSPNGKSLVCDEIVQGAQTDGQHLGRFLSAQEKLLSCANGWFLVR
jgi:hypothetical protein